MEKEMTVKDEVSNASTRYSLMEFLDWDVRFCRLLSQLKIWKLEVTLYRIEVFNISL